jgi:hypothetical protein
MVLADSDVSLTKLSVRLGAYRSHPNSDGAGPPPFISQEEARCARCRQRAMRAPVDWQPGYSVSRFHGNGEPL